MGGQEAAGPASALLLVDDIDTECCLAAPSDARRRRPSVSLPPRRATACAFGTALAVAAVVLVCHRHGTGAETQQLRDAEQLDGGREGEQKLKSQLSSLSGDNSAAQSRLEMGAAAVAAHLFTGGPAQSAQGSPEEGAAAVASHALAGQSAPAQAAEHAAVPLRSKLSQLSNKGADAESRLQEGAAAVAAHLFQDEPPADLARSGTSDQAAVPLRSKLSQLSNKGADAESRLQEGAGALAAHLFEDEPAEAARSGTSDQAAVPLRSKLSQLSNRGADAESRLQEGAAAVAAHLFDGEPPAEPAHSDTSDQAAVPLRSKLSSISGQGGDPEARLEDGAAAIAGHLFDPDTPGSTPSAGSTVDAQGSASFPSLPGAYRPTAEQSGVKGTEWYRVNIDTIVREGYEMDSKKVSIAHAGLFVHVAERKGRRVRVDRAAATLSYSRPVSGWMSMTSAAGHIQILRPSKQATLLQPDRNSSLASIMFQNAHALQERQKLEKEAVNVAKVTAMQKNLDDSLHKVNPKRMAHGLVNFGRHRDEFAKKGVQETQKAGQHIVKSLQTGADKLIGAITGKGGSAPGGQHVGDVALPLPTKQVGQAILGELKKEFG